MAKAVGGIFIAVTILGSVFAAPALAVPLVTYSWTTTSEGFGPIVGQPSSATFQVPLSDVQAGAIPQFDLTNIQLAYPGLSFTGAAPSSISLSSTAYVDPATGNFIYHGDDQGLAVFAYAPDLFNYDTFLSILVDNPVSGAVKDQFNAMNHNVIVAGFPTAGFWTASFPAPATTPIPGDLPLFASGLAGLGFIAHRRKQTSADA